MAVDADVEDGAQVAGAQASKGISRRLLIIGAAALGLLLALGVGSYFLLFAGAKDDAHLPAVAETFIFNLPPMTVNLNSEGDTKQFMKLVVALEVADEKVMEEIQPRMAKVVDGQNRINEMEVSGAPASRLRLWRSALGWVLTLLFAWEVIARPIILTYWPGVLLPPSALGDVSRLLLGMLGLGW